MSPAERPRLTQPHAFVLTTAVDDDRCAMCSQPRAAAIHTTERPGVRFPLGADLGSFINDGRTLCVGSSCVPTRNRTRARLVRIIVLIEPLGLKLDTDELARPDRIYVMKPGWLKETGGEDIAPIDQRAGWRDGIWLEPNARLMCEYDLLTSIPGSDAAEISTAFILEVPQ